MKSSRKLILRAANTCRYAALRLVEGDGHSLSIIRVVPRANPRPCLGMGIFCPLKSFIYLKD